MVSSIYMECADGIGWVGWGCWLIISLMDCLLPSYICLLTAGNRIYTTVVAEGGD